MNDPASSAPEADDGREIDRMRSRQDLLFFNIGKPGKWYPSMSCFAESVDDQ